MTLRIDEPRPRPRVEDELGPPTKPETPRAMRGAPPVVIVRSRVVMGEAEKARVAAAYGETAARFLRGVGPHHAIEVDSSWGAGPDGAELGGFRRDTWIYDEGSRTWGFVDVHVTPPVFRTSITGPATDDAFHGAYRAKVGT
jgi:hypothetical protein